MRGDGVGSGGRADADADDDEETAGVGDSKLALELDAPIADVVDDEAAPDVVVFEVAAAVEAEDEAEDDGGDIQAWRRADDGVSW